MQSYGLAAACNGPGLYASAALDGHYPYLPLWWLVLKALSGLQWLLGGDLSVWFRLPALAGDLAVCVLAYFLAERRCKGSLPFDAPQKAQAGLLAGLGWALNPLAALISAGHGQFDSLPLALLLGAAWLMEYSEAAGAEAMAAFCLAAAVALKTWPIAFLPFFLGILPNQGERGRFAARALLPPLLLLLPWCFLDSPEAVVARISYAGSSALGLPAALKACFFVAQAPELWRTVDGAYRLAALALIGGAFLWAWRRSRSLDLVDSLPWAALTLVLLAPGLSPQYLVWAPALALAVSPVLAWRLSLAGFLLASGLYALFMPAVLAGPLAWAPLPQTATSILAWGGINLLWWLWTVTEWRRLKSRNLARLRGRPFP
jgi:hypothetical protein